MCFSESFLIVPDSHPTSCSVFASPLSYSLRSRRYTATLKPESQRTSSSTPESAISPLERLPLTKPRKQDEIKGRQRQHTEERSVDLASRSKRHWQRRSSGHPQRQTLDIATTSATKHSQQSNSPSSNFPNILQCRQTNTRRPNDRDTRKELHCHTHDLLFE